MSEKFGDESGRDRASRLLQDLDEKERITPKPPPRKPRYVRKRRFVLKKWTA